VLFCGLSYGGIALVTSAGSPSAALATVMFGAILRFRVVVLIFEFLAAASDPARRLTGLTDDEAKQVIRAAVLVLAVITVTKFAREFLVDVVGSGASGALFAVISIGLDGLMAIAFFFVIRRPVARIITDGLGSGQTSGGVLLYFARYWYLIYSALVILTLTFQAVGYLTLQAAGATEASKFSFQIFILTPFIVAGLRIWRDEIQIEAGAERRGLIVGISALIEGTVILLAAVLIMLAWQIDPFAPDATGFRRILPGVVSAALAIIVGLAVWRTAGAFIDIYAPEKKEVGGPPEGEGGGPGGGRLDTAFPILRGFALTLVATITVMVALSALGVQIGPLIASAGVIGLAVGFGSQTLVKDIISGVFYLYEDAFRVGVYIETSEGKGVIEKILLRSVRLRHSRGPIYTIPFGSMGTIQNHSRDWVKVKFAFEVAAAEDLERVRKLVKKVGAQLSEDPEIKDKFIEPLKSQGAIAMVGPNYQIGVKFICPPGEQFLIRRKAFVAIQDAIREHGIKIALPRVVVDNPSEATEAAAAAAATAIKPEAQA
jgi:small-conductance mechanosensitive channel